MKSFFLLCVIIGLVAAVSATPGQNSWCDITSSSFQQQHAYMISTLTPGTTLWQQNFTYMYNAAPGITTYEDVANAVFYQSNTWNATSCCFNFIQGYPRGPGVYAFNKVQSCVAPPQYLVPTTNNAPPSVIRAQYNVTWISTPLWDEAAISYLTGINEALSSNSGLTVFNGPDGNTYFDEIINVRIPGQYRYYSQNAYAYYQKLPIWEYIESIAVTDYSSDIANCFSQFRAGTMPLLNDPLAALSGVNDYLVPLCVFPVTSARSVDSSYELSQMYKGRLLLNQHVHQILEQAK
jgi:hypothetical protein